MTRSTQDRPSLYAAIDLGGTKVRALVADARGSVFGEHIRASGTLDGLEAVLARMEETLQTAVRAAGAKLSSLQALGIASPGTIDSRRGVVSGAPQLPGWRDVPLVEMMARRTGLPVFLENDASAAALGEQRFGAGQGARDMLYTTVSTGVGGGIIAGGELYTGASGSAGELGHVVVHADGPPCGCGGRGCLEALASGTAIARRGQEAAADGEAPALATLQAQEGRISAELVARAAFAGDEVCRRIFRDAGYYLGLALAGYVNVFNPELILLGGGVVTSAQLFWQETETAMREQAMAEPLKYVRLDRAVLGERSGSLGMVARMAGPDASPR